MADSFIINFLTFALEQNLIRIGKFYMKRILVGDLAGEYNTFISPSQYIEFVMMFQAEVIDYSH